MTSCELEAYVGMLGAIRAERMLDAAQVAAYPHVKAEHAREWWRRLTADAQATIRAAVQVVAGTGPRFTFNGMAVGVHQLKEKLAGALGGGLRG